MTQEAAVPRDLWGQIQRMIDERIAAYAQSGASRNLSVSDGGTITIKGGRLWVMYPDGEGGEVGVFFGDIYAETDGAYQGTGILVQDADGSDIATFRSDSASGNPLAQIRDGQGNTVMYTDQVSGYGLAQPLIPGGFQRTRYQDFDVSTTSAVFETLWDATHYKHQNRLMVGVRASMDTAGTTGELRVLVNNSPLGPTAAQAFAVATSVFGPAVVTGASPMAIQIQGRVTSGSGALRVEPRYLWGWPGV